jgi:hypothetical protein
MRNLRERECSKACSSYALIFQDPKNLTPPPSSLLYCHPHNYCHTRLQWHRPGGQRAWPRLTRGPRSHGHHPPPWQLCLLLRPPTLPRDRWIVLWHDQPPGAFLWEPLRLRFHVASDWQHVLLAARRDLQAPSRAPRSRMEGQGLLRHPRCQGTSTRKALAPSRRSPSCWDWVRGRQRDCRLPSQLGASERLLMLAARRHASPCPRSLAGSCPRVEHLLTPSRRADHHDAWDLGRQPLKDYLSVVRHHPRGCLNSHPWSDFEHLRANDSV